MEGGLGVAQGLVLVPLSRFKAGKPGLWDFSGARSAALSMVGQGLFPPVGPTYYLFTNLTQSHELREKKVLVLPRLS